MKHLLPLVELQAAEAWEGLQGAPEYLEAGTCRECQDPVIAQVFGTWRHHLLDSLHSFSDYKLES